MYILSQCVSGTPLAPDLATCRALVGQQLHALKEHSAARRKHPLAAAATALSGDNSSSSSSRAIAEAVLGLSKPDGASFHHWNSAMQQVRAHRAAQQLL